MTTICVTFVWILSGSIRVEYVVGRWPPGSDHEPLEHWRSSPLLEPGGDAWQRIIVSRRNSAKIRQAEEIAMLRRITSGRERVWTQPGAAHEPVQGFNGAQN